ncbi:hypothetical protein FRC08_012335 [Ceratobasidium sp. 394]|nr:hypothetical protein FRC08_012335 [Ceratobasidium sp. 394]
MQTSTRRQVLWDPLGSDRFIVGSSNQIKLYQWDSKGRGTNILASQTDPVNMRCLAWSPHSMVDDLVAIGLATGNVQLLRMGSNIEPFPDQYQDWEGPKVPMLPTKYPRPCQALGFSTIDPNYLAVGLDIARNDPGLLIWDIERSTRSTSPPGSDFPAIQRVVLPSTKPTLNLNGPGDTRPLQYYCLAESVHSLAFLQGSPHLLIAAIGRKQIGMYDLRFAGTINTFSYNTGGGNNNRPTFYSTKSVHGIAVDPLDDNYFASFGDGTAISLWDRRSSSPVMTWAEEDARSGADSSGKSISTIQFSKSRRGELGSLLKGAHVVRLWDTLDHRREALADHTTTSNVSKNEIASFTFIPHQATTSHVPRIITVSIDGSLDISAIVASDAQSLVRTEPPLAEPSATLTNALHSGSTPVAASPHVTENPSLGVDYQAKTVVISSNMLASEIISHLVDRGCEDVTSRLDLGQCGIHPIAGGGFGDIYQGMLVGGAKVAIKCPRVFLKSNEQGNKILKNIAREIYASSKLKHPNVLELIGLSTFRGQISIVSPWMENGTLLEYIAKNPEVNRFQLCIQVSAGLAHLHESDNVHGDVKSPNVLISENGVAKLTDFGNTALKKYTLEFTGTTSGSNISVRWTAPEVLVGDSAYTKEADIYALGMKETITGKIPFSGKVEQAVLATVMLGKIPERPEELDLMDRGKSDVLWKAMSRCWSHEPAERPSAFEVRGKLEELEKNQALV